jgi:hypothetical protein
MKFVLFLFSFFVVVLGASPSWGIPLYSNRYKTSCVTCHTVAPRLNTYGHAFQANFFHLPKASFTAQKTLPASLLAVTGKATKQVQRVEMLAMDGFSLNNGLRGFGFISGNPVTTNSAERGTLKQAYIALPIAGKRGEWGLLVGQTSAKKYQALNTLTDINPIAWDKSVGKFSLAKVMPTVRLDYFSDRGGDSPDGNYMAIGVPFDGTLSLRPDSKWGSPHGLYAQAFQRHGATSLGGIGYVKGNASLWSIVGSKALSEKWSASVTGGVGSTRSVNNAKSEKVRDVGLETDYYFAPGYAFTSRLEVGQHAPYVVGAINFLSPQKSGLQLALETSTRPSQQHTTIMARLQF